MSTVAFQPFRDRILVRPIEEEEGAIKTPDGSRPKPTLGEVVAVGDGRILDDGRRLPPSFGPGDRIYFGKYAGSDLELDGEVFKIMLEEEVVGRVPGPYGLHASAHVDG